MKYNNELSVIDTQEKAYLLGFLYGDGTISRYAEKNGKIRHQTKISIQIGDSDLIKDLKKNFPFFTLGEFDYSKYNENSVKQISISSHSKKVFDDLMLNGLYPRKSYENKDKLRLPDIDDKLISHFIRGFFDADGSAYILTDRPNSLRIEFASVSHIFLSEIESYLKKLHINSWSLRSKMPTGKSKQNCFVLSYIKTIDVQSLINFMYADAHIKMERKAIKCLEYKPVNKVKDRNLRCPKCDSDKIWSMGDRGKTTRYECQGCKRDFSIKHFLFKNIE